MSTHQLVNLVLGILVFAVLMAVRTEAEPMWLRAVVAGCAAAVLGWAVVQARKK